MVTGRKFKTSLYNGIKRVEAKSESGRRRTLNVPIVDSSTDRESAYPATMPSVAKEKLAEWPLREGEKSKKQIRDSTNEMASYANRGLSDLLVLSEGPPNRRKVTKLPDTRPAVLVGHEGALSSRRTLDPEAEELKKIRTSTSKIGNREPSDTLIPSEGLDSITKPEPDSNYRTTLPSITKGADVHRYQIPEGSHILQQVHLSQSREGPRQMGGEKMVQSTRSQPEQPRAERGQSNQITRGHQQRSMEKAAIQHDATFTTSSTPKGTIRGDRNTTTDFSWGQA